MKFFLRTLMILSLLAVFAGGLVTTQTADAQPFTRVHRGMWTATDIDGSNLKLLIVGGGRGTYRLIWLDDYWSICDGDPGLGRGTGTVDASDANVLHVTLSFYCTGTLWDTLTMDFTYDPGTDTMMNDGPSGVLWSRR